MRGTEGFLSGGAFGRGDGTVLTGFDHGSSGGVFGRGFREDGWRPNAATTSAGARAHRPTTRAQRDNRRRHRAVRHALGLAGIPHRRPVRSRRSRLRRESNRRRLQAACAGAGERSRDPARAIAVANDRYATQSRWQLFLTTPPEGGGEEGSGAQTEEQDSRYGLGATSALSFALAARRDHGGRRGTVRSLALRELAGRATGCASSRRSVIREQLSGAVFLQSVTEAVAPPAVRRRTV